MRDRRGLQFLTYMCSALALGCLAALAVQADGQPSVSEEPFPSGPAPQGGARHVSQIAQSAPAVRMEMRAPVSGHYALAMRWFRSVTRTDLIDPRETVRLTAPAKLGDIHLHVSHPLDPSRSYVLFEVNVDRRRPSEAVHMERLDVDWGTPSDGRTVTLATRLAGSYEGLSSTQINPTLGSYWGYCPQVAPSVNLGHFAAGELITIGEATNYYYDQLPVRYSFDPDYFHIEQVDKTRFRVMFDEGMHIGWRGRGVRLGYDDGAFEVYLTDNLLPSFPVPPPTHSAEGAPYCGFEPPELLREEPPGGGGGRR